MKGEEYVLSATRATGIDQSFSQKIVDMAVKLIFKRSGLESNLGPDNVRQPVSLYYDAHCQYGVYADDRFKHLALSSMAEHMRTCTKLINVVHVYSHANDCIYMFGSFYVEGQGHFHGETYKHFWPKSNAYGPIIFKMNLHHGHETYFFVANDWNWKKLMNARKLVFLTQWLHITKQDIAANELHKDLLYAHSQYRSFVEEFVTVSEQNAEWIEEWDQMFPDRHVPGKHFERDGKGKKAVVKSPYKHSEVKRKLSLKLFRRPKLIAADSALFGRHTRTALGKPSQIEEFQQCCF